MDDFVFCFPLAGKLFSNHLCTSLPCIFIKSCFAGNLVKYGFDLTVTEDTHRDFFVSH